jgi:hypothetical protein
MPSDLIDFSDPKFTYHKLFGVKNKLYHHIHHPHLVFYSVFECVLFGVFAILPFLIGFSFKNDLKSFLDPKLIVDNPALQNDDSYTVQQKDGKYQITIDLVYKEAHYYLFDFNQFLDSNHRPLTDNEYDFFYEPSLINKNNHTIVTATSGVK